MIASRVEGCPIERASIDEFYVDITAVVAERASLEDDLEDISSVPRSSPKDVHIEGGTSIAFHTPVERKMMRASQLAHDIRREIFAKEGLSVSGASLPPLA